MWRRIAEVTAATLVALSLWSTHAPGADKCVTPAEYIKAVNMGLPVYDLTGKSFDDFNVKLSNGVGVKSPPGLDELLVFARPEDGTSRFALLVIFQKGCAFSHVVVPLQDFLDMVGEKS